MPAWCWPVAPRGAAMSVDSYDNTVCSFDNCLIAFGGDGEGIYWDGWGTFTLACCDIFGNEGGDWTEGIADQAGTNGNFSADPLFCDPDHGDFALQADSPCAPPGVTDCGQVGALPVGCGPVSVEAKSWGRIKAMYR